MRLVGASSLARAAAQWRLAFDCPSTNVLPLYLTLYVVPAPLLDERLELGHSPAGD